MSLSGDKTKDCSQFRKQCPEQRDQCQNERQISRFVYEMQELSSQRLILVLQSDPTHAHLIQEVLVKNDMHPQIIAIDQVEEALDFLHHQGKYANSQRPDLILLDLDLEGNTTGYDILSVLKADPGLRRIPVIVLTMSERGEDIFRTYAIQGNCYVIRPGDRDQLIKTIRRIEDFWLTIVTLPHE